MEQVFKAIDKDSTGQISLSQLQEEIEELGSDIDENPMIAQLIQYLRHVHSQSLGLSVSQGGDDDDLSASTGGQEIWIDFESFVNTMTNFAEGVDRREARKQRVERQKLPRFKVPVELLKKYSITPKGSPMVVGGTISPNAQGYSHTVAFSPSRNKFNKMFSQRPVIQFDQFLQLATHLNNGKEIPKNKLLMVLNDLPKDSEGCIDINSFLTAYGGLNHPMSPKLVLEESDVRDRSELVEKSTVEWNKNRELVNQLSDNYKVLEKEVETYQSEISFLEKSKQTLEAQLKKKEQEIERLKKETKFVDGMRDTNKDLIVQNTSLKQQISKLTTNESALRDNIESEKDKYRSINENLVLKDLEIKKLNHQLKTQQNINTKLSMMISFNNESEKEKTEQSVPSTKDHGSKTVKVTQRERSKPNLSKQKSEIFQVPLKTSSAALDLSQSPIIQHHSESSLATSQQSNNRPLSLDTSVDYNNINNISNISSGSIGESIQSEMDKLKKEDSVNELDQLKKQLQSYQEEELTLSSFQSEDSLSNIQSGLPSIPEHNSPQKQQQQTLSTTTTTKEEKNETMLPPSPIMMSTPIKSTSTSTTTTTTLTTSNNNTPIRLSSPFIQTPNGTNSPRSVLTSQSYVRQSSPALERGTVSGTSATNMASPVAVPTFDLSSLSSNPNVGSIKRMKKSDLIRLQMNELEAHKESAQNIIDETTAAMSNLYKEKSVELQRIQKMYQEEKQSNKYLEKQLMAQLEKNKELTAGKEKNSWGGMQGFYSFVSYFLPSTLMCNVSGTS
ncbi:hypothetical protein SAMD00019534_000520 [Acytostelium subglobosum LB1]|uniref:hypothetical protein n=1 Tax=Acytostelium subglobosum LB1 TaxID=1410327 RepID=UPI000644B827|nr:hypothetical protein SAMD00019534_000520 [Acytostelium subglobosum LB1]GAM16877.1 hypothetical protein SAMD00019534_000520 [Acytostelium subglobosum LB1]|eukprot:XP_012758939.1 hypothetical protein SAMD00019534_000520 [Acytostelium subglobosum LB1]